MVQSSVTEQISQMSLSDISSIPEEDSLDTSNSLITSTPSKCENVNIEIYRITNKTVLKIEQASERDCLTKDKIEASGIQLEDLGLLVFILINKKS